MYKRCVSWPRSGNATTFKKRIFILGSTSVMLTALGFFAIAFFILDSAVPLIPLAISFLLLSGLWIHSSAQSAARKSEIERSFSGLRILHLGESFVVSNKAPIIGVFTSRRHASCAAMQRGRWAAVVHAWDRYYLLACTPSSKNNLPVALRSRAIADVIPAIHDVA